jgi:hypothetical protein
MGKENPVDPHVTLGYGSARGEREERSLDGDGSDRITHMGATNSELRRAEEDPLIQLQRTAAIKPR